MRAHPQRHLAGYAGLFQADAFDGYRPLYLPERRAGPILEVGCWSHARRPFFTMADIEENARRRAAGKTGSVLSPIAIEVVRRIDALFEIERSINGKSAEERRTVRQERSKPWSRSFAAAPSRAQPVNPRVGTSACSRTSSPLNTDMRITNPAR